MHSRRLLLVTLASLILLFHPGGASVVETAVFNIQTNRYNNERNGANVHETRLSVASLNPQRFGKLFSREVVGDIYAQPLYLSGVTIPGKGQRNVVYVATAHNNVYAFDADDPRENTPLWQTNLGTPFTQNLYDGDFWHGEDGVLSTPVIDVSSQTMYLVSHNYVVNVGTDHYLHALDILTGAEKFGGPVRIRAGANGTAEGNTRVNYDGFVQLQRPGLLLLNGWVYIAFGSTADRGDYHGWVVAYNAADLQKTAVFCTTPDEVDANDAEQGGIWHAGTGISSDGSSIYVVTGNGSFNANLNGGHNYGDSIIRLDTNLNVLSYFTPYNQDVLNRLNYDLGINGLLLLPGTNLAVSGTKEGKLYVVDRQNLGGYNPTNDDQVVQWFKAAAGEMHSTPVFWNGPNGLTLYSWSENDFLKAYRFDGGRFNITAVSIGKISSAGVPPVVLSLSSNGSTPGTGIVWASHPKINRDGILRAFDASDLTHEIWNSEMNPGRDAVGIVAKFNPPVVANGKVYMASFSNRLNVYGPISTLNDAPSINYSDTTMSVTLTWARVTWALGFEVQADQYADFRAPFYQNAALPGSAQAVTVTAPANGTYYWRVRAKTGAGTWGGWSAVQTFTVYAP
jgi:hypothetical protein